MLIDLDSNDVKCLLDVLDDASATNAQAVKQQDEITRKLKIALLGWQHDVDIKALAKMGESHVLTREQLIDVCTRLGIPVEYVLKGQPQTSVVDTLRDR